MSELPVKIEDHDDGCSCSRCVGLEPCPSCGRVKLDIVWCYAEKRLVFAPWATSSVYATSAPVTGEVPA